MTGIKCVFKAWSQVSSPCALNTQTMQVKVSLTFTLIVWEVFDERLKHGQALLQKEGYCNSVNETLERCNETLQVNMNQNGPFKFFTHIPGLIVW